MQKSITKEVVEVFYTKVITTVFKDTVENNSSTIELFLEKC
jgi:hypothetical protein